RPRLGDDGLAAHLDAPRARAEALLRAEERDAARARGRVHALAVLADEATGAVRVRFARLAAAHVPVAAGGREGGAHALETRRAGVRTGEARLAALFSGVDPAVAALE